METSHQSIHHLVALYWQSQEMRNIFSFLVVPMTSPHATIVSSFFQEVSDCQLEIRKWCAGLDIVDGATERKPQSHMESNSIHWYIKMKNLKGYTTISIVTIIIRISTYGTHRISFSSSFSLIIAPIVSKISSSFNADKLQFLCNFTNLAIAIVMMITHIKATQKKKWSFTWF